MQPGNMGAMDTDALKMYLQNIEEYVMDEDKIVTYKWLSKNLDIHVNTAKQLLYYFASTQKNNVNITYLIGGVLNDETGCKMLIVREEDLEVIKKQFKVLTSQHVYSIQKAKALRDLNFLYAVDSYRRTKDEGKERLGAITYSHPVLRSEEEVERLRKKSIADSANMDGKQWPSSVASTNKKQPASSVKKEEVQASAETSKEENNTKKDVKTGGIAAMFAAQSNKSKQHDNVEGKGKVIEKRAAKSKGNSRISVFFSRQPEKVSAYDDTASNSQDKQKEKEGEGFATDENLKPQQSEKEEVEVTKRSENTKKDEYTVTNKVRNKNTKQTVKKQDKNKKRKLNAEKDVSSTKKRKRIVVLSDSEESSDDGIFDKDDDGDDEAPDSPSPHETALQQPESDPEDMIPPTPEIEYKKGRKRVRKLKDKTYLDEDGYLLTKKEYVFESCTDSEGEAEKENERKKLKEIELGKTTNTNSAVKQLPAKKKTSPQKTKQASLMIFFKKNS